VADTVDSLGMPHVRPVGLVRRDTTWYFNASPDTVRVRNIASEPRCVVSLATDPFDLVVEGAAVRVTDAAVHPSGPYTVGTAEPFGATRFDV
jgi:general stress protein 26